MDIGDEKGDVSPKMSTHQLFRLLDLCVIPQCSLAGLIMDCMFCEEGVCCVFIISIVTTVEVSSDIQFTSVTICRSGCHLYCCVKVISVIR